MLAPDNPIWFGLVGPTLLKDPLVQGKIYFLRTRIRWAIACKSYPILIYVN